VFRNRHVYYHNLQFNSNVSITQCQKDIADCIMVKLEFLNSDFLKLYMYNHNVALILYIN